MSKKQKEGKPVKQKEPKQETRFEKKPSINVEKHESPDGITVEKIDDGWALKIPGQEIVTYKTHGQAYQAMRAFRHSCKELRKNGPPDLARAKPGKAKFKKVNPRPMEPEAPPMEPAFPKTWDAFVGIFKKKEE